MQSLLLVLLSLLTFFTPGQAHAKQQSTFIRSERNVRYMPAPTSSHFQQTITSKKLIITPTSTPTPTKVPQSSPTSNTPSSPSQSSSSPSQSGDAKKDFIMKAINDYRSSKGLSSVSTNNETCDFAKVRASEIVSNFNHDGFSNRINSHSLPYSSYHEVTENIAMNSDYKDVVNQWINSPGHAENMRRDTPYVCVESSGNYYAYEGLRP